MFFQSFHYLYREDVFMIQTNVIRSFSKIPWLSNICMVLTINDESIPDRILALLDSCFVFGYLHNNSV
jgi:hypothetical protein